jgi:predicted DNA-binding transcriptional regulator AlpA
MKTNFDVAPNRGALRKAEAAAFVGLPVSSWDRMVKKGQAPRAIYVSPRRPVWSKESLLAWLRDLGCEQERAVLSEAHEAKEGKR